MMRPLKRKRVEAPHIPTFEDVHPYTTWTMCVRVYHKFEIERFGPGRKRLDMVLLDENGKKMVVVLYDGDVDRFQDLLVEGRVYYVSWMSAEPAMRSQYYKFADSRYVCRFTSVTMVNEVKNATEKMIPLFPPFIPFDRVWEFTTDNDTYIDRDLHTTEFSRLHFDPDIAVARELKKRINNDLREPTSP